MKVRGPTCCTGCSSVLVAGLGHGNMMKMKMKMKMKRTGLNSAGTHKDKDFGQRQRHHQVCQGRLGFVAW